MKRQPTLRLHNWFAAITAILTALFLPSCIKVEQDIWLGDDGSGRVMLKFGISKQMTQMMNLAPGMEGDAEDSDPFDIAQARKALGEDSNVTSFSVVKEEDEKFQYMLLDIELADVTKLDEALASAMADGPGGDAGEGGEFSITFTDAGTYKIKADLGQSGGNSEMAAGAAMFKSMMGDSGMVFRIHAEPVSADSHNGTLEDGAVVWESSLSELMEGKEFKIEGEFYPGGGTSAGPGATTFWIVLSSILVVAAVLFFVFRAQKPAMA